MNNIQTQTPILPKNKNMTILKWLLVAGITIVLNLFFNYTIKVLYNEPNFDDFCPQKQIVNIPQTKNQCIKEGGAWTDYGVPINRETTPVKIAQNPRQTGYCDLNFICGEKFREASSLYGRNVFVVLVVLGVISLVVAFFVSNITAVSMGLSFGGILSLIIGSLRYWSSMNDYLRVIILGLALATLIVLGIKKIKD